MPGLAAATSSNGAARALGNWADCSEDLGPEADDGFTVRCRSHSRPRSSTGWAPRAEEIRTTRAHIAEARARQASSTEDQCVYLERSPELEPYHYMRAIDRMFGGTREVFQMTKMNGHFLVGLANRGLAECLVNEGLEVEGTLHRAFPFRKRAVRITVGNLPFYVGDAAVISALTPFGRVTSIAPKLMKAGPYIYNDGRREAFIILREGMTIERLPTRLDISFKGEAWPEYLSSGIRCSRCRGQGHRRANCPLLAGRTTEPGPATPTSHTCVPPATAPRLPQQPSAQPPPPASPSPTMEDSDVPPASRAALHPPAALRPSPPAPSALPVEEASPTPPPVTPTSSLRAPEDPAGPRSATTTHLEPTPPARPDLVAPRGPLPVQETLGHATQTPDGRASRITIGNLPFFVRDAVVIDALARYGRVTSIAPKQLKVGEFDFTDGRREAFIFLHDGITVEKLPKRFEIKIKGEAWPSYLIYGIKCSRFHGQGHRRASCPLLYGQSTTSRRASPPSTTNLPPSTAPGLPRQSSAEPPSPAPPSPSNKAFGAPSDARAASLPSAAPWPSSPAPPASPMQAVTPAPPPMTPSPEDPETLGPAAFTPDIEMTAADKNTASPASSNKKNTRDDLVVFLRRNPGVSFAGKDALGLGREEVLDLHASKTKAQKHGPLLTPPQSDALAGLIDNLLDLRPGGTSNLYKILRQVKAELRNSPAAVPPTTTLPAPWPAEPTPPAPQKKKSTPAMATPPLPPSAHVKIPIQCRWPEVDDLLAKFRKEPDLEPISQSGIKHEDLVDARRKAIRRPRSSTGWAPRAEEIRTTMAHIAEARARQASSTEDHCVYVERSPDLEPFHYTKPIERMVGGTREVIQVTKMNGHFLVGLANRGLAERLVNEDLEVEGTLHRAFPFRKRAERITVGNLPFFVGDAAVISALTPFGLVTSIVPKLTKAGPYIYNDGRREAFIILHEGMTIERHPTRLDISIKGEAWPAYLSSGIRWRTNDPGPATPTSPTSVPPVTAPQQPSAQPPPPASPSPTMEVSDVPPASRAALHPPAALRPSPPAPSALPVEDASPAPPPVTPTLSSRAPEDPAGSRSAATSHLEPTPPARPDLVAPRGPMLVQETLGPAAPTPDVEISIIEETSASSTSSTKNSTRNDLVLELLASKTKAQRHGPLLTPPQSDALAGLIDNILDLRPGGTNNLYKILRQVKAELRTTPAAVPPKPTLPAPRPAEPTPPAPQEKESTPAMATLPPPPLAQMELDLM
ncbi:hypothetical protein LAZ67_20001773 [Cordylochernes scorpioides]|uniref:CCHC-type domain-containing protein n=1 Tax=Cordylochernes scorpioides TaxID=51811 RepID=A0ABY6LKD7_9ARAC|nr:hypothetical protein LAZ67_20001773 [Cordylochernes scorpioides]